jgi:hypothetical protein
MRTTWFTYATIIFLCIFGIVCFAVDDVIVNVDKFSQVLQGFPPHYWIKTIAVALIGTSGSLLLVAKKHPALAAMVIAAWWIPSSMAVFTAITALIYMSPNQVAASVGTAAALGLSVTACLLIGQLSVTATQNLTREIARQRTA